MIFISCIWIFICGISNRIRGGWLEDYIKALIPCWATTPARLFVSFMISFPLYLISPFWEALFFHFLLYLGFIFRWSPWNIMQNPFVDIPCLSLRGLLLTFPAGYYIEQLPFALSGLSMGLAYFITWHIHPKHIDPNGYEWNGSDWGELFFGMTISAFLMFSLI